MDWLRQHTDHDLSLYKKSTIQRRIERRMQLHQISSVGKYAQFLKANTHEIELLFKELLIGVTGFFRDPESFEVLKDKVLSSSIQTKSGIGLRVWVPGCSTGEEAYSLAIIIRECLEQTRLESRFKVQVFATDINKESIDRARQGLYGYEIEKVVTRERLQRYFSLEDDGYRVQKGIREMVVFAPQNMIMDPPFTKIDVISCRNVLIYFTAELQKKSCRSFTTRSRRTAFSFWDLLNRSAGLPRSFPTSTPNGKCSAGANCRRPRRFDRTTGRRSCLAR